MAKYISNRQQNLKIGIVSYTEDKTVLEVIGNVGIGTTNPTSKLHVVGDARITGILTIGTSSIVLDGANNKIYVGSGVTISATEISIGSNIIGSGGFSGNVSSATFATNAGISTYATNAGIATYATNAGIATYATNAGIATFATSSGIATYATNAGISTSVIGGIASVTQLSVSGISTLGVTSATNLTSQQLNVSGNLGIGTTNPTSKLWVDGDGYFVGVLTANRIFSSTYGEFVGGSISGTNLVGTSLSISGISTLGVTSATNLTSQQLNVSGITTVGFVTASNIYSSGVVTATTFYGTFAGNASSATYATNAGIATNLKGGATGNIPYQSGINTTAFLENGGPGTILQSNGDGNLPTWVTPAAAGAITGLTIRDKNNIVSGLNSVSALNFVGSIVSVASTAGIATITFLDYVSNAGVSTYATNAGIATYATNAGIATFATNAGIATYADNAGISTFATNAGVSTYATNAGIATYATNAGIATYATNAGISTSVIGGIVSVTQLNVSGISTFTSGPVFIGAAISTGTALQRLQVTDGAYVSGSVGIGTTNPTSKLQVQGDVSVLGIITATQFSTGASGTGINISTDTISGPSLLYIDPAAVGDNTGAVRIKGDLYVDGTQFIVNSTTIEFADFNVGIASTVGTNALLDGAGIGIGSTGIRKTLTWSNSSTAFKSSEDFDVASGKVYKINGTSVLSNTTLGSDVTNSSLTSVGTLGQLQVTGVSTFTNGPILVGTATSTGTASQPLQVTGGAYVSGNLGIGATNPTKKLTVSGDALINGLTVGVGTGTITGNTVLGYNAFFSNTTGTNNTAVGTAVLYQNLTGNNNTAIGHGSQYSNDSGNYNTSTGSLALYGLVAGQYNVAIGYESARESYNVTGNVAIGGFALRSNYAGSNNVCIGYYAGYGVTTSNNVIIGPAPFGNVPNVTYQPPIPNEDTQLVIGAGNTAWIHGNSSYNIGIGTTNATSKLHVVGDARVTGVVTATSFVKTGGTSSQFLKADGSVDVNNYTTDVIGISYAISSNMFMP